MKNRSDDPSHHERYTDIDLVFEKCPDAAAKLSKWSAELGGN